MSVFDFTEEDLIANEAGKLTSRQRKVLSNIWWRKRSQQVWGALFLLMLGLVMGGLADFYLGCIMTLPAAYMGFITFIHWLRVGADIEQGKILKTCGVVIQSNRALHWGNRDL